MTPIKTDGFDTNVSEAAGFTSNNLNVIVSSDDPELAAAVLEAVRRWRFEPARRGFESTSYAFRLTVDFYLE